MSRNAMELDCKSIFQNRAAFIICCKYYLDVRSILQVISLETVAFH